MLRKTKVKFNVKAFRNKLFKNLAKEQTRRLIEYAMERIKSIGEMIASYDGVNHMDDTGNLLDSLCWGVSYEGKMKGYGFYRKQVATELSYLHEWDGDAAWFPVGGHTLASNYIRSIGNLKHHGWRVFFAVLAPYWGYWEKGFTFKSNHGWQKMKFAVMTQYYDVISNDLKPATVNIKINIPPTTDPSVRRKVAEMRDYRHNRGLGSPYDKYPIGKGKGKYNYDKSNRSRYVRGI